MKLYKIQKTERSTGKVLFSTNATELGLCRLSARIANGGRSDGSSASGRQITVHLAFGELVTDPAKSSICWSARCLGNDFRYCSGLLFPTMSQLTQILAIANRDT